MKVDQAPSYKIAIKIMSDIVVGICEREKQLDLLLAANYIDHYRAYVELCSNETEWVDVLIDFEDFIIDQTLLTLAAAHIAREANEKVTPLDAL
ncbi:MAG: hypothetical protein V3U65_16085 [Granulosicoccaceae bacterium]